HHADLAVYRAKLQGRNRVLAASAEPLLLRGEKTEQVVPLRERSEAGRIPEPAAVALPGPEPETRRPTSHAVHGPRLVAPSSKVLALVGLVALAGFGVGIAGLVGGSSDDVLGMLAVTAAVAIGQSLALEVQNGSISIGAVGALTGVALFGPR